MVRTGRSFLLISCFLMASAAHGQGTTTTVRRGGTLPTVCSATSANIFYLNSGVVGLYESNTGTTTCSWTYITTANVTTSAPGLTPTLPNDGTLYLNGLGTYSSPIGASRTIYAADPKYNLPASGFTSCNATLSNGSNIVQTDTVDPPFTSAMVGWIIMANSEDCQTFTNSGVNRFPTTSTTITGFTDAHHVTVSSNANGSCTASGFPTCQLGWFPADSQSALQSAWNDALTTGVCANVVLPAGYYAIGSAITNSVNPAPCGLTYVFGVTSDSQSAGVIGQGMYVSKLVPLPSFNGNTCAAATEGTVCLFSSFQIAGPSFRDFAIDGLGFNTPPNMSGKYLLGVNYLADVENIMVTNWAGSVSANSTALIVLGAANALTSVHNFWCFAGGYNCVAGTHQVTVTASQSFNMGTGLSLNGENNYSAGNSWYIQGVGSTCAVIAGSGVLTSVGDVMSNTVGGNQRAALCPQSGAIVNLFGDQLLGGTLNAGKGGAIAWNGAATVKSSQTKYTCQGGAGCLFTNGSGVAGAVFQDTCGNDYGGFTPTLTNLTIFGSCSATGTTQTTGNIALTSGWDTSTKSAISGSSALQQFTITAAGTPTATPRITITHPVAFLTAPICSATQVGGTQGVQDFTTVSTSATTAVFDWNGTPVAGNTLIIQVRCSLP